MMHESHLQALQRKLDALENEIRAEMQRPASRDEDVRKLKERRLHLCEEIDRERKSA